MKFFEGIKTLDELRKEYRRLAFIYHPDKGGDTAFMQVIMDDMRDAWGSEKVESQSKANYVN
ncbi:MAG TPA: hypothetical protein DCR40_15195 [Prolixibacteraceae bacterium]|nr:hypothetical protein [Prolixibacteraceae bacterium]